MSEGWNHYSVRRRDGPPGLLASSLMARGSPGRESWGDDGACVRAWGLRASLIKPDPHLSAQCGCLKACLRVVKLEKSKLVIHISMSPRWPPPSVTLEAGQG